MTARIVPWILALSVLAPACSNQDDDDRNDDPNDPAPSSWLVGERGEMLQLRADDDAVSTYPLDHAGDLQAIACTGIATAWVVGDDGTVLVSRDAGQQWTHVQLGFDADLRSVAVAEAQPEGQETVWVAGYDGAVFRTDDGGRGFSAVQGPAIDWTAVATNERGDTALLTGLDGSVWRSDGGAPLVEVLAADGAALYDIAMGHHGDAVVAVGEAGRMLRSDDAGETFTALDPATELDLHAVQVTSHGDAIIAVGESGVVLHIDERGARVQLTLDADDTLFDLHLRADGLGQTVGTRGIVLLTDDGGQRWRRVSTGRTADLRGVDDFHTVPHL